MPTRSINSVRIFAPHWLCWKILGVASKDVKHRNVYLAYSLVLNVLVTSCYPIHLVMVLFRNATQAENVKNLAICVICFACSLKFIIYAANLHKVTEVEHILKELDARINSVDERNQFERVYRSVRHLVYLFLSVYLMVAVTAELSFIFSKERELVYPAWFPFDWHASTRNYYLAIAYQMVGAWYQMGQNYVNDCLPPTALYLLSGHIDILGLRLSRIGYDEKSQSENEAELQRCIVDQKNLYKLFCTIQDLISLPIFIQLLVAGFNICIAIGALVFFFDAPLDRLNFVVHFISMLLQIYPICYFGSKATLRFAALPQHIYACNWVSQSHVFRSHMMIFTERSLADSTPMALGMVKIHLDTFLATCSAAYTQFAVLMHFKN